MSEPYEKKVRINNTEIMVPVDIQGQNTTLEVDTLAIESSVSKEIDTSTESSPVTLVTPSSGKKIETRGIYIFSDSGAGEVTVKFPDSGIIVGKLYCSKFNYQNAPKVRFVGATDESLQVEWSGLDTGAKIFVIVVYREV